MQALAHDLTGNLDEDRRRIADADLEMHGSYLPAGNRVVIGAGGLTELARLQLHRAA